LIGYYHKFVKNYGEITTPLTMLFKKEAFSWTQEATKDFGKLKEAMPNFKKTFIVECDVSGLGIGAILMK
jgi:hypothetical protein